MYRVLLIGIGGVADVPTELTGEELRADDTIDVVKKKILTMLEIRVAYEEIYLYADDAPLGQIDNDQIPANPFDVLSFDGVDGQIVGTRNNTLLMDTTYFGGKTVNVCIATDVLNYVLGKGLSEEIALRQYFPMLKVNSLEELNSQREALIQAREESMLTFERNTQMVNLFYEYSSDQHEAGIRDITFVIHPAKGIKYYLPLESVFKLIHTTRSIPITKYNPGIRFENVYRLHTNGFTASRKKIPVLSKPDILKYDNSVGKNKSVSVIRELDNAKSSIACLFQTDGSVEVVMRLDTLMTLDAIDKLTEQFVQPVIDIVGDYLKQSGYEYLRFESIRSERIEVVNMTYEAVIPDLQLGNCAQVVFNVIDASKGVLRFKRVSGYNEMDAESAHLTEMVNRGLRQREIVAALQQNFGLTKDSAVERYDNFLKSQQVVQDTYRTTNVKSRDNPGFLTEIREYLGKSVVTVTDVDHIGYLETIPVYLHALGRIPDELCTEVEDVKAVDDVGEELKEEDVAEDPEDLNFEEEDYVLSSDEEEEESSDEGQGASAAGGDDFVDKDGNIKLKKPDPFKERNTARMPEMFNVKKYAFQENQSRVPIAITDEELADIEERHPGSFYDIEENRRNIFKYKASDENEKWFICPRYWSFEENSSVTHEWVETNKKDVYSKKNNNNGKMPKDGVYEFYFKDLHDNKETGNYEIAYPGFKLKDTGKEYMPNKKVKTYETNENGFPMIGCYKKDSIYGKSHNANEHRRIMHELKIEHLDDVKAPVEVEGFSEKNNVISVANNDYIQAKDKFPLPPNRFGYLPPAIERFLQTENEKCQKSKLNPAIKDKHACLLRQGIETSSLLACIADILDKDIDDVRSQILSNLNLDIFHQLRNGNLVQMFDTNDDREPALEPYETTKLYQSVDLNNISQKKTLQKVVRAYENYRESYESEIWDLVTSSGILFPRGANIFVMELADEDIVDKVYLVCPPNPYAETLVDDSRPTLLIIKRRGHYEPVYAFRKDTQKDSVVLKTFDLSETSLKMYPQFPKVLGTLKQITETKCRPLPSEPKRHEFKRNISLQELIQEIQKGDYVLQQQVLNFQGKVIGVIANDFFVPCYPSAPVVNVEYTWMNNIQERPYDETKSFLTLLAKTTKIACAPQLQIVEEGRVVGLLTNANQFVPVVETASSDSELEQFKDVNHFSADETSMDTEDNERIAKVEAIYAEEKMFSLFRNRVRLLMRDSKHRKSVERILSQTDHDYEIQLEKLDEAVRNIMARSSVLFVDDSEGVLLELAKGDRHACANDARCELIISKVNFINGFDNEEMYYGRIADELLRYSDLRDYMMNVGAHLQLEEVDYNLGEDEILLLHSMLTTEYFSDMIPTLIEPNVNYGAYDISQPLYGQTYSSELEIAEEDPCEDETDEDYNEDDFPEATGRWIFANSPETCSFNPLLHICEDKVKTVAEVKKTLIRIYEGLIEPQLAADLDLILEKEKTIYKKIKEVSQLILNEGYRATIIDFVALANEFSIPLLLVRKGAVKCFTQPESEEHFIVKMENSPKKPIFSILKKQNDSTKFKLPEKYIDFDHTDLEMYIKTQGFRLKKVN